MSARLLRILADLGHPVVASSADLATSVRVIDLTVGGLRVTLTFTPTASSRAERSPDMQESARFLDLADQVLERFRPYVLLTYGGHPACLELMRGTRLKSVAVVVLLHHSVPMSAASDNFAKPTTGENRKPGRTPRSRLTPRSRPESSLTLRVSMSGHRCCTVRNPCANRSNFAASQREAAAEQVRKGPGRSLVLPDLCMIVRDYFSD